MSENEPVSDTNGRMVNAKSHTTGGGRLFIVYNLYLREINHEFQMSKAVIFSVFIVIRRFILSQENIYLGKHF